MFVYYLLTFIAGLLVGGLLGYFAWSLMEVIKRAAR